MTRPRLLLLLPLLLLPLLLALAGPDRVARKRSAPGVAADLAQQSAITSESLVLTDLTRWAAGLDEAKAPAPEQLTCVTQTLDAAGQELDLLTVEKAAWRGLRMPIAADVGNHGLDLNEVRVKLLIYDASGRPTRTFAAGARVFLKVGRVIYRSYEDFAKESAKWKASTPVIVDARGAVPMRHVLTTLTILCAQGRELTIAAPEFGEKIPSLTGLRAELERAAKAAPLEEGVARVGLRIRADARCPWSAAQAALAHAQRLKVARFTFAGNAGELEIDLFPRKERQLTKREPASAEYDKRLVREGKKPGLGGLVEKPIIVLEEEVELEEKGHSGIGKEGNKSPPSETFGTGGATIPYPRRYGQKGLQREGGDAKSEGAVQAALAWLKLHQSQDGRWRTQVDDCPKCKSTKGDAAYDVGNTSLATLAFLGNGHTHRYGRHKRVVNKSLRFLKRQQKADGSIGVKPPRGETFYNHAYATQALCDAYACSRDFTLKRYAEKAVGFVLKAQNPNLGWKYGVKTGRNDTSVTGAMLLALVAARDANLDVPGEAFEGASRWFVRATDRSGSTGYESPGGGSSFLAMTDGKFDPLPVNTAIALFCRIREGDPVDLLEPSLKHLLRDLPTWDAKGRKVNFYYWYYGTYATHQAGGAAWRAWNPALKAALIPNQEQQGCAKGSWAPKGEWCSVGGRVYATAMGALSLEVYYRYERGK